MEELRLLEKGSVVIVMPHCSGKKENCFMGGISIHGLEAAKNIFRDFGKLKQCLVSFAARLYTKIPLCTE